MDTSHRKTAELPLAVWPCAQKTSQWQRHGRYLPESNRHPAKMLPALPRRETYGDPGDLVVDPMCGIGTTLVEAASLGRHAIGVAIRGTASTKTTRAVGRRHPEGARSRSKQDPAGSGPKIRRVAVPKLVPNLVPR